MAGIHFWVDNVDGNDSNNGLTKATAKKTHASLIGIIATLDILHTKATGVPYAEWGGATSAGQAFFGNINIQWTNWDTDTDRFIIPAAKNGTVASNYYTVFAGTGTSFLSNVEVHLDYSGTTNTTPPILLFSASGTPKYNFTNVVILPTKVDNLNTAHVVSLTHSGNSGTAIKSTYTKCSWINQNNNYDTNWLISTGSYNNAICSHSIFFRFLSTAIFSQKFSSFTNNRIITNLSTSNQAVLRAANINDPHVAAKNTIYVEGSTGMGNRFVIDNFNTGFGSIYDNVIYSEAATTGTIFNYSSSANQGTMVGNNLFINGDNTNNPSEEFYGLSDYQTGSHPFLSLDPYNENFLICDKDLSIVQNYVMNKAFADTNGSRGSKTLISGGGETDPSKVLNTSSVVSGLISPSNIREDDTSGQGTLSLDYITNDVIGGKYKKVIPSNVRGGVEFGVDEVGDININEEANLPSESKVIDDTSFGENLEFTGKYKDVAPANVREDVEFGVNLEGELNVNNEANLPSEDKVLEDTLYGANEEFEGQYKDLSKVDVRKNVNFGVAETGELDVNEEANLPAVDKVEKDIEYGENLEFTGTHDTQAIVDEAVQEAVDEIIDDLPNRYTFIQPTDVTKDLQYKYANVIYTGLRTGYNPIIDETNLDIAKQIKDNFEALLFDKIPEYSPLDYRNFLEKNSSRQTDKRLAVLYVNQEEVKDSISCDTIQFNFRLLIVDQFNNNKSNLDDSDLEEVKYAMLAVNEKIRRLLNKTNSGNWDKVRYSAISDFDTVVEDDENYIVLETDFFVQFTRGRDFN